MAIASKSKRAATLMEGIVIPSGTIDAQERAAAVWSYEGNSFSLYENAVSDHLQIGEVGVLFENERIGANVASKVFSLQRDKPPFGAAFQIEFSGDPSTVKINIQCSETNSSGSFVTIASITAVNAAYVGRYDMVAYLPKYVRMNIETLTNDVIIKKAIVSR